MKFLLDTNIVILASIGEGDMLRARLDECDEDDLVTSTVAMAEVAYGSARGKPPTLSQLQFFLEEVPALPFDVKAALAYAILPLRRGRFDRLIGAHALSLGVTLITDNVGDFADIPNLTVENWTR